MIKLSTTGVWPFRYHVTNPWQLSCFFSLIRNRLLRKTSTFWPPTWCVRIYTFDRTVLKDASFRVYKYNLISMWSSLLLFLVSAGLAPILASPVAEPIPLPMPVSTFHQNLRLEWIFWEFLRLIAMFALVIEFLGQPLLNLPSEQHPYQLKRNLATSNSQSSDIRFHERLLTRRIPSLDHCLRRLQHPRTRATARRNERESQFLMQPNFRNMEESIRRCNLDGG